MLCKMDGPTTFEQIRAPLIIQVANRLGRAAEALGLPSRALAAADLIEVAKRRTGLDDFGGGEFFEPLSRLLESCYRDAQLNVIGKLALRADITHTLCNRLALQADRQSHPEIAAQEIRAPLFVVGLPRSGTTLLHMLLAADPANRAPLTWEVMTPSPPSDADRKRRIEQASKNLGKLRWLAPSFQSVHTMGAELPQECVSLMSPTFLSDQFDTMYNVPTYRAWFLQQDLQPAYQFHRRFLQHLQQRDRRQRWVLKAPAHMFGAAALLSVYPDACFVQTHRHPTEALASVSSLIAILRRVFSDTIDPIAIGRDAMDYWADAINNFMRERERLSDDRVCDVSYQDIRRDAMGAVRRVYKHFGWPLSPEVEQAMRAVLATQSREGENGNHRYDPSQFGIDAGMRFTAYMQRFGLNQARDRDGVVEACDPAAIVPPVVNG